MRSVARTAVPASGVTAGALALLALATLLLAAPARAIISTQIVATINAERHANGIPPVTEDPALSAGCAAYDEYRRMNGDLQDAFTPGAERPALPGYTAAGSRASHDSLLNAGDTPGDSWSNGDVFDTAPGHLQALMDPALAVIGADELDFSLGFYGTVSLSCVDVRSAPGRSRPRTLKSYLYRGPDGRVPPDPAYREGPRGNGPYLFSYFLAPKRAKLKLRSVRITGPRGEVIEPSYLHLTGGLADARRPAHTANKTTPSTTPGLTIRLPNPLEDYARLSESMRESYERMEREREARWRLTPSDHNPP